jgi:hypothetical protein
MTLALEAAFDYKIPQPGAVWTVLAEAITPRIRANSVCTCDGRWTPFAMVGEAISQSPDYGFGVCFDDGMVSFAAVGNYRLSLLFLDRIIEDDRDADKFVSSVSHLPGFLSARVYDAQYERIQNATELEECRSLGIDTSGIRLRSNGLPFPLERQVVDTSANPGRRVLRHGFVEAIGHRMWLSPTLLQRLRVDSKTLRRQFRVEQREGVTLVQGSDAPFSSCDASREVQDRLRAVLFPPDPRENVKTRA